MQKGDAHGRGRRGAQLLVDLNEFMTQNANVIMMVIFVILGANFIGQKIGVLTS